MVKRTAYLCIKTKLLSGVMGFTVRAVREGYREPQIPKQLGLAPFVSEYLLFPTVTQ